MLLLRFFTSLSFFLSLYGFAQTHTVFVFDKSFNPIQFCSFIQTSKQLIFYSDSLGRATVNFNAKSADSILIKHLGYKEKKILINELYLADTIFLDSFVYSLNEILVSNNLSKINFRNKKEFGIFKKKYDGAYYINQGHQVGILLNNNKHKIGILLSVKIHFQSLNKNSLIKLGIISVDENGNQKEDLLKENFVFSPKNLVTKINFLDKNVLLADERILIYLESINDTKDDKTINKIRTWNGESNFKTFNNFMNLSTWKEWKTVLPNKKFPLNVQIQAEVLFKD